MAKPILVANWKNNPKSLFETQALVTAIRRNKELYKKTSLFIAPPLPYLGALAGRVSNFAELAVQDINLLPKGTYTGEVTSEILKTFKVMLAIIGHSERRALGETPADIAVKVKIALKLGITPLICVGENEKDHDGEHFEALRQDLKLVLSGLSKKDVSSIAIAYEPVWAIGKSAKDAITSAELTQTVMFIKKVLADLFGRASTDKVPILYGGSVEPANARELMQAGVKGFLVGHASLNSKSFEKIVKAILEK